MNISHCGDVVGSTQHTAEIGPDSWMELSYTTSFYPGFDCGSQHPRGLIWNTASTGASHWVRGRISREAGPNSSPGVSIHVFRDAEDQHMFTSLVLRKKEEKRTHDLQQTEPIPPVQPIRPIPRRVSGQGAVFPSPCAVSTPRCVSGHVGIGQQGNHKNPSVQVEESSKLCGFSNFVTTQCTQPNGVVLLQQLNTTSFFGINDSKRTASQFHGLKLSNSRDVCWAVLGLRLKKRHLGAFSAGQG